MNRLCPAGFTLSPEELPKAKLDEPVIKLRLRATGIAEERHAEIVAILQAGMDAYCLDRLGDKHSATPSEVRAYCKSTRSAVEKVRGALKANRAGKAVIDNAQLEGLLPSGFTIDLEALLGPFQAALAIAEAKANAGEPKTTSGKVAIAERHRKLLEGFIRTFEAIGLPIDTQPNGLMLQLFGLCLDAVEEKQTKPQRVVQAVEKRS